MLSLAKVSQADAISWDAGTGDWFDQNNWDPAQVPTNADDVTIANGGTAQVNGAAEVHLIQLGSATDSGTLEMNGGSLTTVGHDIQVGVGGVGAFEQNAGDVTVGVNLNVGLGGANGNGTYTIDSGSLDVGTAANRLIAVGNNATVMFNQNGGDVATPGFLHLGRSNGNGTYNMNGGTLTVAAQSFIAGGGGNAGVGEVNQTDGNANFNNRLNVGGANFGANADGTWNISGGTLTTTGANDLVVGGLAPGSATSAVSGTGLVDQSGGGVTVGGNLILGAGGASATNDASGEYSLSAGTLNVSGGVGIIVGNAPGSTGSFTQTGGTITNANNLWLGRNNSTGSYNLEGGELVTSTLTASGAASATFNWTGGTLATNTIGTGLTLITNDGGVLSPGASSDPNIIGATTFLNQNSYDQTAAGTLAIDIASESSFDEVIIGTGGPGTAQLNGIVAVTLLAGYDPTLGTTFDVLRADSITDLGITATGLTPSGLSFSTSIVDMSGAEDFQVLRLTVVPEPGAFSLLMLGTIMGLATAALRRRGH